MIPLNKKKKDEEISNLGSTARKLAEDYVNFNYDTFTEGDTYKSLEKRYDANGQKAMQNTLGQVAARTGGMASSYATSAANQSYNDWMSNLEDAARSLYESERKELGDRYSVANGMYLQARDEQRYDEELAYDRRWNEDERTYNRSEKARLEGENDAITTIEEMIAAGTPIDEIDPNLIKQSGYGTGYWGSYATNEGNAKNKETLDDYMAALSDGVFVDRQTFIDAGGDVAVYDAYKQAYDEAKAKGEAANKATVATSALNALIETNADVDWDSEEIQKLITESGKNPLEWNAKIAQAQEEAQAAADAEAMAKAVEEILTHIKAGNGANTLKREFVEDSGRSWEYWKNYEKVYKASQAIPAAYEQPTPEEIKETMDMIYAVDKDGNYTNFKTLDAEKSWISLLESMYGEDFAANVQTLLEAR